MALNAIYVETDEEVPEVVERLRRYRGDDTMIVLPMRSRIGQSRFNFQLLRNYAARMGKRVTVVCDDPAVQKMAAESGFPVFGAVGPEGDGIPSEPEAPAPPRKWWQRARTAPTTHIGIVAPNKLITKTATELRPGRFILYITAGLLLLVGLFAALVYIPSASITLVAQAVPFTAKDVELQGQPSGGSIHVRVVSVTLTNSQGFKTNGTINVPLAPSFGTVVYSNRFPNPHDGTPGICILVGQRLMNTNQIEFAQTTGVSQCAGPTFPAGVLVPWQAGGTPGTAQANVLAVNPGSAGNVGNDTITTIENSSYDPARLTVTNPQATGGGTDPSSTPQMTEADFDAGRAQLEQELHQQIAQKLETAGQPGETLSDTIIYGPPTYQTDHQPGDSVPSFSGTMTISGEGDFYNDSDVRKAFQNYLSQRVPTNVQLLTESPIQVDYRILSATGGGNMTFVGTASAYVAPRLDENAIRSAIVGRPLSQARFYLEKLPVRSVSIQEEPLTLPLMPLLIGRISLHYVVQQGTVNPGAASGGTTVVSPTVTASP